MRLHVVISLVLLVTLGQGCARTTHNYTDPLGPRYAGGPGVVSASAPQPATLRVVTFNLEYASAIDSAISLLQSEPALSEADLLLLQEMDDSGTRRIADALGLNYIYYPATLHPVPHRDFGNAILSRWPLRDDRKIILPHHGWMRGTQRVAVTAVMMVGDLPVQVYSVHLAMMTEATGAQRRAQARTILEDASRAPGPVIIGGDLNSDGVGEVFSRAGMLWPTRLEPPTKTKWFRFDHLFFRGLGAPELIRTGVVADSHGASDHRPVWAVANLSPASSLSEAAAP